MIEEILKHIIKWFNSLFKKILENPIRNILMLVISVIFICEMGKIILSYGIITLIGYICSCVYGISKIIDNPNRTFLWGVGYVIGAITLEMIPEYIFPELKDISLVSILSILVILYVILQFYSKSQELKNY